MIKKSDAYEKAFEQKRIALAEKEAKRNKKISMLYLSVPKFSQIEREIGELGARLALTAISGDSRSFAELKEKTERLSEERSKILCEAQIGDIDYDCPLCHDTGYINGKICECVKKLAQEITVRELSKELPLSESRFENFDLSYYDCPSNEGDPFKRMSQIFAFCKKYTENFDPSRSENLLFMGDAGLGKTHLSLAIVYELLQKGFNVIYGSAHNLFSIMETEQFSDHTTDTYDMVISCDLLVIDDLGSEFVSSYRQSLLYNIVNTRLLAKRPTVLSTNNSMKEIEERYTPRISSRLIGSYTVKKFIGRDIRQIKALSGK